MDEALKPRTGGTGDGTAGTSAALERLRRRYAMGLRQKVAELQACWELTPPDLAGLERAAHRLAGTSGSFGFTEIGHHAAALEELLHTAREAGRHPSRAAVEALLNSLRGNLP